MSGRDANQLAADATTARRGIISALIAVKGHLDQPYPDDDRWTPWTRFVEPALQRLDESVKELVALVGTLQQEDAAVREHLREFNHVEGEPTSEIAAVAESTFGFLRHRAEAAEARVATLITALKEIDALVALPPGSGTFSAAMRDIARRALADTNT